jgi:6-phosphogluconolactonase (cycloisomerase 2 family)
MYTIDSCGAFTPTTPATAPIDATPYGSEQMVVDPLGRFAYVANLVSNASDLATISMYTINSSTGVLTPTTPATVPTGFYPQGIGIDPSGKFVYTANSDDNTVSMFTINPTTGILTPTSPATVATGDGPVSVNVDPSGRFAYVANQDDDTISMYTVNSSTGVLSPTVPATVPTQESPFGVTVTPNGKFAYVPNAYSELNSVTQYTINQVTGVLTPDTPSYVTTGGQSPTSIAVDPSGKFAYVADRQTNSGWMFTIDPNTGMLTSQTYSGGGPDPFRLGFDPSGKFLYFTNEAGEATYYTLNSDGTLKYEGSTGSAAGADSIVMTTIN